MDEKEYIEREALLADFDAAVENNGMGYVVAQTLKRYVKRQPAADVAPVRHGRWKYDNSVNFWKCSHCGENAPLLGKFMQLKTKYFPNCGARMDLE